MLYYLSYIVIVSLDRQWNWQMTNLYNVNIVETTSLRLYKLYDSEINTVTTTVTSFRPILFNKEIYFSGHNWTGTFNIMGVVVNSVSSY